MDGRGSSVDIETLLLNEGWVTRLARALVRDDDDAADLAQEARIAFWRRPPREPASARSWLGTVVRNLGRNQARERRARDAAHERASSTSEPTPSAEATAERFELHRELAELVAALDEPFRQMVVMRYYEGLSAAEIARRLDVPAGTVRWRIKTALDRLRGELDQKHGRECARWQALLTPLVQPRPERSLSLVPKLLVGPAVLVLLGTAALVLRVQSAEQPRPVAAQASQPKRTASPRASALVRFVLPALAAAGGRRAASEGPPDRAVTLEQARAAAARKPEGGLEVTVDDALVAALNRLVGTDEARAATRQALARMSARQELVGEVLDGYGVPRELAAVALLESGFDDAITSDRSGAVGVWQLTKGAAKARGLAIDDERDERLDPRRETEAAAGLLSELYRRFGSWDLAVAAYHQGSGAVRSAIAQAGTRDAAVVQARGLLLPYRSGVLAAVLVMREPALAD
jgi:membrane-bound lytic murein transglycosylase D